MGMYVVARLAARHRIRVELRAHKQGGLAAVVVVPAALLAPADDPDGPQSPVEAAAAGEPARLPSPRARAAERKPKPKPKPKPRVEPEASEHTRPDEELPGITAKGLPQRVPRATELVRQESTPVVAPVDAEALRRRLGGFQQGLREGRAEADAEAAEIRAEIAAFEPNAENDPSEPSEPSPGGPDESEGVEEARG
jgi:hypothetical protein